MSSVPGAPLHTSAVSHRAGAAPGGSYLRLIDSCITQPSLPACPILVPPGGWRGPVLLHSRPVRRVIASHAPPLLRLGCRQWGRTDREKLENLSSSESWTMEERNGGERKKANPSPQTPAPDHKGGGATGYEPFVPPKMNWRGEGDAPRGRSWGSCPQESPGLWRRKEEREKQANP